jgi:hypothetical protein
MFDVPPVYSGSIFALVTYAFGIISKKSLTKPNIPTISSSRSLAVLGLIFQPLIHFELIFVDCIKKGFNFILMQIDIQFTQDHLVKKYPFLHCVVSVTSPKIIWL